MFALFVTAPLQTVVNNTGNDETTNAVFFNIFTVYCEQLRKMLITKVRFSTFSVEKGGNYW